MKKFLSSAVGEKFVVAITGVALAVFVLSHMSGNMLILVSADAYNAYSYNLISNPLLPAVEIGLLLALVLHVVFAIKATLRGRMARGAALKSSYEKAARFGSKYMALTGLCTLGFIIWHLLTFKYGPHYTTVVAGKEMRDLHKLIVEVFSQGMYMGLYVVFMALLALHLGHGASAMFQTLGWSHVHNSKVSKFGWAFTILVCGGFVSQPLYVFFMGVR